jgi:preprotein translocase subunit YajC
MSAEWRILIVSALVFIVIGVIYLLVARRKREKRKRFAGTGS